MKNNFIIIWALPICKCLKCHSWGYTVVQNRCFNKTSSQASDNRGVSKKLGSPNLRSFYGCVDSAAWHQVASFQRQMVSSFTRAYRIGPHLHVHTGLDHIHTTTNWIFDKFLLPWNLLGFAIGSP